MNVFYTLLFLVVLAEILFFPILEWVRTLYQGAVVYTRLFLVERRIKHQLSKLNDKP